MAPVTRTEPERAMSGRPFAVSRRWLAGLLITLLAGCAPLPDDEAARVLADLAAGAGPSRLKQLTPDPARRTLAYALQGRTCAGDLYVPGDPPHAGIVLVPGVAERGKDDARLVAFATTLARARFLVLVPDLPNLRALRVQASDAQGVVDAFDCLLSRAELPRDGRVGVGAFSYAVGPAVLAALDPAIRARVDFLLGVGGYYDLRQVVTFFTTGYFKRHGEWTYLEPNRYGKWVFVLSNLERLADPGDRSAFRVMAGRRLGDPHAPIDDLGVNLMPEGRALLALLENRDPLQTPALIDALPAAIRTDIGALNLAGRDLSRLRARLILLHGTIDGMIPYTESMALAAAVPPGQAELYLVDGLAHMDIRPFGLDRRALWRAVTALLAQRGKANP